MDFQFIPLDEARHADWDRFVAGNSHAWVSHDRAYIEFEQSRGLESISHLILDERGRVVGVSPLFLKQYTLGRLLKFHAIVTGTSLRAAPLIAADMPNRTRRDFWKAWAEWSCAEAARRSVDEIRVNFPHFFGDRHVSEVYEVNPLREHGFRDVPNLTMLLDFQSVNGDLTASFEGRCRNSLKKAASAGAEWEPVTDRETWLSFEEINRQTFADDAAEAYTRKTMEIVWDRFVERKLARVAALRHEGRVICAGVRAGTGFSEYNWMLFAERPRTVQGATNLFMSRDMEEMRARGVRWCEIGSLEFDDPRQRSIAEFKRSFGGKVYHTMDCKMCVSPLKLASAQWVQALAGKIRKIRKG